MTRFEGKIVLVTGGTSGIGLAGAERLRDEGARVIVTGRSPDHIAEARERLGPNAQVIENDAADPSSPDALLATVEQAGGLDALWLNAAYASAADIVSLARAELERMFAINVFAPMLQIGRLAPLLRDGGAVLVTSSTSAHEGQATLAAYAASKGAVLSAARCWAAELAPRGIRVNTLVPGPITTNLRERSGLPATVLEQFELSLADAVLLKRVGEAREAASAAVFLLSSDASYITGSSLLVDGGLLLH